MNSVSVLGGDWSVTWIAPDDGSNGLTTYDKTAILVDPGLSPTAQRDTLLHECLHAVDHLMDTGLKEKQVRLMATGILDVLRSNPELVAFLLET